MEYTEEFFETVDIDWFSCSKKGRIAHFASAGSGFVPTEIKSAFTKVQTLLEYVESLPDTSDVSFVEDNIPQLRDIKYKERYLATFAKIASKGLFSYDVADPNGSDQGYVLIAQPLSPLLVENIPHPHIDACKLAPFGGREFPLTLMQSEWEKSNSI